MFKESFFVMYASSVLYVALFISMADSKFTPIKRIVINDVYIEDKGSVGGCIKRILSGESAL